MTQSSAGPPRPWPEVFDEEAAAIEQNRVSAAGLGLLTVALVQGGIANIGLPWSDSYVRGNPYLDSLGILSPQIGLSYALLVVSGVLIVLAGLMAFYRSRLAAYAALIGCIASLVLLALRQSWVGVVFQAGAITLVIVGIRALHAMRARLAAEGDRNPLVAQYRDLLKLLVRMMAADEHIDRRECAEVMKVCDSLKISRKLQKQFLEEALDDYDDGKLGDLDTIAERYRQKAESSGLPHPNRTALMAAAAVAAADGVFGAEEQQELERLGSALGASPRDVEAIIVEQKAKLEKLTPELARQLLGLEPGATPLELDEAYAALRDDLNPTDFAHVGESLQLVAKERLELVDKAYATLREA